MTLLNRRVYQFGVNAGLTLTVAGIVGACAMGVWWAFAEAGPFWGFAAVALCGFLWAAALDILYNMWGVEDVTNLEELEEELDNGVDA